MIQLISKYKKLRTVLGCLLLHIYIYQKKSQTETQLNYRVFKPKLKKVKLKKKHNGKKCAVSKKFVITKK